MRYYLASFLPVLLFQLETAIAMAWSGSASDIFAISKTPSSKLLCADPKIFVLVGLAADAEAYTSIQGKTLPAKDDKPESNPQQWKLVDESNTGPSHSLTGKYLQVLPDEGRTYPGRHEVLKDLNQLENNSPYVSFHLKPLEDGWHTLFLRWTGGDTVGGGDSMFVSLRLVKGRKNFATVAGRRTLKPKLVPIDSVLKNFAGCCYDMETHACPCITEQPSNHTCPFFQPREKAAEFGAQCSVGPGVMEFVDKPSWYLFAGQEVGNVMDFSAEPWDATCEAEGSNTADSGRDFATWDLKAGSEYELRVFAREDGTALDAIYLAGPSGAAPGLLQKYNVGDSTFCEKFPNNERSSFSVMMRVIGFLFAGAVVISAALFALGRTEQGALWLHDTVSYATSRAPRNDAVPSSSIMSTYEGLRLQEVS